VAYAFDFINPDGSVDHFDLGFFADDTDAMRQARAALSSSMTAVSIEVWREGSKVGCIQNPARRRHEQTQGA